MFKNIVRLLVGLLAVGTGMAVFGEKPPEQPANIQKSGPAGQFVETPAAGAEVAMIDELDQGDMAVAAVQPTYVPPRLGAPKTRVGGGTRSQGAGLELALLAPEHTGITAQASPKLFWWVSRGVNGEVEFVVTRRGAIEPDFRVRRTLTLEPGIHALDLNAEGVALEPGETYQWSVAIVRDPDRRSRDMVGVATVEYVPTAVQETEAPALAADGFFYDAIAALDGCSDQSCDAKAVLLEQVALTNVAHWVLNGS